MFKKMTSLILVGLLVLPLTGCWNRRELNELGITVGIGIDKIGSEYKITAQVVVPSLVAGKGGSGDGGLPVTIFTATNSSVLEALRQMTTTAPRRIYLSHLRMMIVGESMAREGLNDVLDFFSRSHEVRSDFFIAIAKKDSASNILKLLTPLEKIPANSMFLSLQASEKFWAPTKGFYLDDLLNDFSISGNSPVITGIEIKGNKSLINQAENTDKLLPPVKLEYVGLGVFKKDKLIGWLNPSESKAYNYITGKVEKTVGHLDCPEGGGRVTIEVVRTDTKTTSHLVNGHPEIDVTMDIEADVGEVTCNIKMDDPKTITMLNDLGSAYLKNLMEKTVEKAQTVFKTDFLGFGSVIHRTHPKEWDKMKDNWNEEFTSIPVHFKVNHYIRRVGSITNTIVKETKE
ncbi:Ger(x)C family spore germination protein [Paenibacillus eucommiae]|uniref:Spore germination protein KC n=1 Tax=Paenibacillus eucommiae TaxID=1355755 RepID=A0ABS4IXV7_9BACL|nr:Ger(x)C family spore germination protein [Paenibacillus eucommiae]MBP1992420.1 spore germination protein KC [Paenibacillus eucommiae]